MIPYTISNEPLSARTKQARVKVLLRHVFFGSLLLSTPYHLTEDLPTAATDMSNIYLNPGFMAGLASVDVEMFVLAHEVMHIAMEHGLRRGSRNPQLWNQACDYVINALLLDADFTLWEHALYDKRFAGMSAEQVYDILFREQKSQNKSGEKGDGSGAGSGKPTMDDLLDPANGGSPEEVARVGREVRQRVAAAANIARMQGKLSGDLERLVNDILNPKVPWQDMLRDYVTRISKDDEAWNRRNRRFSHIYLPARYSEKMGEAILIDDTSGSISHDELRQYNGEAKDICDSMHPERLRIVYCDSRVKGEQVFEEDEFDPALVKPKGGGGTDMRVALEHVEQYDPEFVILFTDGFTPWPDVEPSYPLIVCCTTDAPVPVGSVVRI